MVPDDDMRFGGEDFGVPEMSVPDHLLSLGGDEEQMTIDPRQLGLEGPDLSMPVETAPVSDPDGVAQQVETALLALLGAGRHDVIMAMAGDRPASAAVERGTARLRMAYAVAVRANPALRWYAKFAALLPADKISAQDGALRISMAAPMFKKVVAPFLGEFRADWAADSPITAAVRSLADNVRQADISRKQAELAGGMRRQSNAETSDLDVASLGMADAQAADLPQTAEGVPFTPGQPAAPKRAADPVVPRLPISLTDLSLKAVVDHIAGMEGDDDTLMGHLLESGFPKARANEILAMLRYKRVSEARRASLFSPQGNRGAGAIEFDFR